MEPSLRAGQDAIPSSGASGEAQLAQLAERLEISLDPQGVFTTITKTVASALPAQYAAVCLRRLDSDELVLVAEHRVADGEIEVPTGSSHQGEWTEESCHDRLPTLPSLSFPLLDQGETVGHLLVVPDEGANLTAEQRDLLTIIANRAGSAARVVRQAQDLLRARERLVLAREEERRRLRRNLHDTIGPTLAALNLKAGTVRNLIEQDPLAAQEQMNELRQQIQSVITDIRRVVYDLRPPALDELGILLAIREQASQFSTGGLQVIVDAPNHIPVLPAAVEVATYRIVMEALTNVERHAHARLCRIRISVDERVNIEVVDDGVGLPANHHPGVGIASMRERVTELGGSCKIESTAEGGTRVLASLPASSRAPGWDDQSVDATTTLSVDAPS